MSEFNVDIFNTARESRPHSRISRDGACPRQPKPTSPINKTMDNVQNVEYSELQTRTSYVDAHLAYLAIKKGKAGGNKCALWVRWKLQQQLFSLGCFIQKHSGKVLFVGLLLLSLSCAFLKAAHIETNVEKLWVEDGGRLQRELAYTKEVLGEGHGSTSELILQTGGGVLTPEGLLLHYEALVAASKVTVHVHDIPWKFQDLCIKTTFHTLDGPLLPKILENLLPCVIVTPLDCFWEGSKLLGPEQGIYMYPNLKWSNLHPQKFLQDIENHFGHSLGGGLDEMAELMDRAGITSGYQEKPCLNPQDPECPSSAPNKNANKGPDVGSVMTGGCRGFAPKYMHWEEELIVGGITKNRSGQIIEAKALQSIIQLMGEENMYVHHRRTYKVNRIDWDQKKAKQVLEAWQRAFTQEVTRVLEEKNKTGDEVYPFSSSSLFDLLTEFSKMNNVMVILGFVIMIIYACVSLFKWSDLVNSQCTIGVAGVLLVGLNLAAGLGISSVIVDFNASTMQIIPFLALGLGVNDMFLLAYQFGQISSANSIPYMEQTGECLKRSGVSVLLTSISIATAFFLAAIIPIPALRAFVLQAAILTVFNVASILLVFPAIVSLDLWRRQEGRIDFFCCFSGSIIGTVTPARSSVAPAPSTSTRQHQAPNHCDPEQRERPATCPVIELQRHGAFYNPHNCTVSPSPPYSNNYVGQDPAKVQAVTLTDEDGSQPTTILAPPKYDALPKSGDRHSVYSADGSLPASTASSQQCLTPTDQPSLAQQCLHGRRQWFLPFFAKEVYGPQLEKKPFKIFVLVCFSVLLIFGIVGTTRVEDGLDITDIVPKGTSEYAFLEAQSRYFGFYNFFAVTKDDFDYAGRQKLLLEYHAAFRSVDRIIKKEDGSLPHFWLTLMRTWLKDMQKAFDRDKTAGCLHYDGWYDNATAEGRLGYRLMVQSGDIDEPVDKSRFTNGRLVHEDGTIDRHAFYNYLSAWSSNDALAYASCQAQLRPEPKQWYHEATDGPHDLQIPKSQPLVFAQLAFYLHDLGNTHNIVQTIKEVREICDTFSKRGLPTFPIGVPFTFFEQYVRLRLYLGLALLSILVALFVGLALLLCNPWIAVLVVVVVGMVVLELFGFMGLAGVKLSAIPAVILIVSVGMAAEFTVHISVGFLTCLGSRQSRVRGSLHYFFTPVCHGAVSTFLGILMLAFSEFDFVVKYFFAVLAVLVLLGALHGLLLLPVLLSMFGPSAEVIPSDGTDIFTPPTPEPSPKPRRRRPPRAVRRIYPKQIPSDISLSTITEEPSQYSSQEITVQPHVVVETVTVPGSAHVYTSNSSSSANSSPSDTPPPERHVTRTKVKATATVKVEVHTPRPGAAEYSDYYRRKKRRSRGVHKAKDTSISLPDIETEAPSEC